MKTGQRFETSLLDYLGIVAGISQKIGLIETTNQLDAERLLVQAMLEHYTIQGVSVERGFHFLKDPLFFAHSLFLKKTDRIMAATASPLAENNQTILDQKGKPTQAPTMRWVFQLFQGLDVLTIR